MSPDRFRGYVRQAARGYRLAVMSFMAPLRDVWFHSFALLPPPLLGSAASNSHLANPIQTVAVFQYLRNDDVVNRMDAISSSIYEDLRQIELHNPLAHG